MVESVDVCDSSGKSSSKMLDDFLVVFALGAEDSRDSRIDRLAKLVPLTCSGALDVSASWLTVTRGIARGSDVFAVLLRIYSSLLLMCEGGGDEGSNKLLPVMDLSFSRV